MINTFKLSVSVIPYSDKNSISWGNVKYRQQELTISDFADLIKQGYCFCQCFKTQQPQFGLKEKADGNFEKAYMIFVDVDDSDIDMKAFVGRLSKQPTVYYTTPNNHTEKSQYKYRFRLCYLFDEAIISTVQFQSLYDIIINDIAKDIDGFICKDNCGRKASQQFSGNGSGICELCTTHFVYSLSDFPIQNNNASSSSILISNGNKERTNEFDVNIEITDREFMTDLNRLKPIDLIEKYRSRYQYFTHTELKFSDGYALIPSDYQEIYRSWYLDTFTKNNGNVCKFSAIKKLHDGNSRRKKLYIAALIMKMILPTITFEHLLFNLINERLYYYDNSDGVLTNKELIRIAKNVVDKPIDEISLNSRNKRKFVVDKAYCHEHGISPNAMKNKVRKKLKDEEIGSVYDCSMSLKENLSLMNEMGIRIGKSKLYQWCKENGINTKGEKLCEHNPYSELQEVEYYYFISSKREDKETYQQVINHLKWEILQLSA